MGLTLCVFHAEVLILRQHKMWNAENVHLNWKMEVEVVGYRPITHYPMTSVKISGQKRC